MAIYSLSTSSIKRGNGRSAVAAAAYRAGSEIVNERTGMIHDYTRKSGVEHVEIFTRKGIPAPDMSGLWNAAEAAEKRKDGRTAREVLVALPAELDADQRLALARELTADLVDRYGVAAQLAVHAPDRGGDQRNHHAHVLLTTRTYGHDGLGKKGQLEWSGTQCRKAGVIKPADELKMLRERWADMQNRALKRAAVVARVDHRSLADQSVDRVPQIHIGPMGTEQMRRGTPEQSERAMTNLAIIDGNQEVAELRQQVAFEKAEQHVEQKHQLQIRAEMRALYSTQQRLYDEREAREEAEWKNWLERPEVCSATGRIYTEAAVDACIQRERALLENQPPAPPAPWPPVHDPEVEMIKRAAAKPAAAPAKPSPMAKTVVDVPDEVQMATERVVDIDEDTVAEWYAERKRALPESESRPPAPPEPTFDAQKRAFEIIRMPTADERAEALREVMFDLDMFDALQQALETLMTGLTGEFLPEGERLRSELLSFDEGSAKRSPPERDQEELVQAPRNGSEGPGF